MSERGEIGILNPDGTVDFIYCHWCSGSAWFRHALSERYPSMAKARELIDNGAISYLGDSASELKRMHGDWEAVAPRKAKNARDFWRKTPASWDIEWRHLLTPNGWVCRGFKVNLAL